MIESHGSSNLFNRLRAVKQAHSGRFDTKSFDGLGRCLTRFSTKGAAKLPNAEVRRLGKTLDWYGSANRSRAKVNAMRIRSESVG